MQNKFNYNWLLILIPVAFLVWFLVTKKEDAPMRYLPYYGPKYAVNNNDTNYHVIPDFSFVDQNNEKVTKATFNDKIYVAEYFFTTCKSICPIMNNNLELVYKEFSNSPDVSFLSHTVDPEHDSVPVLKDYAVAHGVNDKRWRFVTGDKKQLYELARKGYLLDAAEGNGGEEDFIHTQKFALVDKESHIRGYYDGTDSVEILHLKQDIKLLLKEYEYKNKVDH